MEVTQVAGVKSRARDKVAGVRTRARDMATVDEETVDNSPAFKKRKLGNEKLSSRSSTLLQTKSVGFEIYVGSVLEEETSDAVASLRSGGIPASCYSSTGSTEKLIVSDLEGDSVETGTAARYHLDGNESAPTSELKVESGEVVAATAKQSPAMNNSRRIVLPAEKMPPEAELEEFFAAAQENLNKRFISRYNYDIVNDIPLKGRFEWIQVKPENEDEDNSRIMKNGCF